MLRFDNWTCCLSQDKAADTLTNSRDTILLWQSMLSRTECLCGSSLCPRSQSRCICSSSILSDWHGLESLYECFWKMGTEEYILDRLLPKALPRALLDVFNRGKKLNQWTMKCVHFLHVNIQLQCQCDFSYMAVLLVIHFCRMIS